MILLAPLTSLGGIATWAAKIEDADWERLRTIDTSPHFREPSEGLRPLTAFFALLQGGHIWLRAIYHAVVDRDVIWATVSPSVGFRVRDVPFLFISRAFGVNTIVHIHGSDMIGLLGANRIAQRWAIAGLKIAGRVIVLDKSTQLKLSTRTRRTIEHLPNFIDLSRQQAEPASPPQKWLYVGRISLEKGSQVLLDLASRLPFQAQLTVIGPIEPSIEASFREACRTLPVVLTGAVQPDAVRAQMLCADTLILPSHHEGFPMVVLEAMTVGLPVISSDVGACAEMLVEGPEEPAGAVIPNPVTIGPKQFAEMAIKISGSAEWAVRHRGGSTRVSNRYRTDQVLTRMRSMIAEESK